MKINSANPPPHIIVGGRRFLRDPEDCLGTTQRYVFRSSTLQLQLTFFDNPPSVSVSVATRRRGQTTYHAMRHTATESPFRLVQAALKDTRMKHQDALREAKEELKYAKAYHDQRAYSEKVLADALNPRKPKRPAPPKKDTVKK